jgi:hypothetical protein
MNDMVLVRWHDARLYPDTYSADEVHNLKMLIFETAGYLLSKDSTTTILACEHTNEGQYRNIILIPSGSIISIRRLFFGSFM